MTDEKMKTGIVGTGRMAAEAMETLAGMPGYELSALCCRPRSLPQAQELAARYGIQLATGNYNEFLEADIDIVYIAFVNSAHYEPARQALLCGKHVIVEKPMCPTLAETQELVRLAREKHLLLFEAVTTLHFKNFFKIRELLPRLGNIHHIICNYSQLSSRYDRYLAGDYLAAFDPQCAGGSLLDLNVYNLNFVAGLFGTPTKAAYHAVRGYNGIDTSGTLVADYPGMVAVCTAAKDADGDNFALIKGEKGWLRVNGPVNTMPSFTLCTDGERQEFALDDTANRLTAEFECFAKAWREQDYPMAYSLLDTACRVMETIELAK
jgi:predicted dehydrogenase